MTFVVARWGERLVCDRLHCGNARILLLGAKVLHFRANRFRMRRRTDLRRRSAGRAGGAHGRGLADLP